MNKKCRRCQKAIKKNDWYFIVREFNKQKVISNNYLHKSCQNEYDDHIKENLITPEKKEQMFNALKSGFQMVKKMQERIGMEE